MRKEVGIPIFDTLLLKQCAQCGVWFAYPITMDTTARREGGFIHCPNGHSRGWKVGDPSYTRAVSRETVVIVSHPDVVPNPTRTEAPVIVKPPTTVRAQARVTCHGCLRTFRNKKALGAHRQFCKGLTS